jgi:putative ABC transport system permease protein
MHRDRRGAPWLEHAIQDLRYGVRQMVKNPMFTVVAVATLAVGIGANTAVFSIVHAVLLADLPYTASGRLVTVTQSFPAIGEARMGVSPPEYFAAMGIPIVRGRAFNDADVADTPLVVVVNETLARRHWPNRGALGEQVLWGGRRLTIVGVSGDVHITALDAEVEPTIYCSVYQVESGATTSAVFILRSGGDPGAASAARAVIRSVDSGLPTFDIRPMTQVVGRSLAERRFTVAVVTVFAGFALGLAVVGLYAVLSHAVTQRTQELGIRLALGASPWGLLTMVMRDGLRLVTAGLVIGGLAAVNIVRSMSLLLFGVNAIDPVAFAVASCMLLLVSLFACCIVARQAAILDPITALRAE